MGICFLLLNSLFVYIFLFVLFFLVSFCFFVCCWCGGCFVGVFLLVSFCVGVFPGFLMLLNSLLVRLIFVLYLFCWVFCCLSAGLFSFRGVFLVCFLFFVFVVGFL